MVDRVRAYTIEARNMRTGLTRLFTGAFRYLPDLQIAIGEILRLDPTNAHARYTIRIGEVSGKTVLYVAADLGQEALETIVAQDIQLADGRILRAPAKNEKA